MLCDIADASPDPFTGHSFNFDSDLTFRSPHRILSQFSDTYLMHAASLQPHPAMQPAPPPKLKILALHSFRTSATIFKDQLQRAGLLDPLSQLADIHFLDAPNPASGPIPDDVAPFFPAPYYEWWNASKGGDGKWTYAGVEKSLAYLSEVITREGPFHGVMGFSQGAASAALIVGAQRAGRALQGAPPLDFLICFAGLRARDPQLEPCYGALRTVPSIHIIGDRDPIKRLTNELIASFDHPVVINHTRGHVIPPLTGPDLDKFLSFVRTRTVGSAL